MRVFLLTIDSSCFSKKGTDYPEVKKLKKWQENGWVDLIKSGVLEKESEEVQGQFLHTLKGKTKNLSTDYGPIFVGHTSMKYAWPYFSGKIRFEEVYKIIFGEWQRGKKADSKMRDAIQIFYHLINDRDYFVTKDIQHLIAKATALENNFGIRVRVPQDCIKEIEAYWKKADTFPPEILQIPKIVAGTCIFEQFFLKRLDGSLLFGVHKTQNNNFVLRGSLYSPNGKELVEFSDSPIIKGAKASLHQQPSSEDFNRYRIILEKQKIPRVIAVHESMKIFEAQVLSMGHLLLWGEFYNEKGEKVASATKDELGLYCGGL